LKTLLFVDDHPLISEGARRTLEAALPELRVTTASSKAKALAILEQESGFDLCLSDQKLGDGEGVDLVEIVRARFPTIAVGVLTGEVTRALVRRLRAAGAIACLSKTREIGSLCRAIRLLYEGEEIFDEPRDGEVAIVSERRREILGLAGSGLLDKEIGRELGIAESTVRNHWQHIFERLGASNRTEAVTKAIRRGII
jgi:DNA-binding NarL/FixJ family response regulator